jgi:hypothetical protein
MAAKLWVILQWFMRLCCDHSSSNTTLQTFSTMFQYLFPACFATETELIARHFHGFNQHAGSCEPIIRLASKNLMFMRRDRAREGPKPTVLNIVETHPQVRDQSQLIADLLRQLPLLHHATTYIISLGGPPFPFVRFVVRPVVHPSLHPSKAKNGKRRTTHGGGSTSAHKA